MKIVDIGFDISAFAPNDNVKEYMEKEGFAGVFSNLAMQGIAGNFPEGIPLRVAKILSRIQVQLKEMDPKDAELKLEEAEFDLLKTVFLNENARFQIGQVQLASHYSVAMENAVSAKANLHVAS